MAKHSSFAAFATAIIAPALVLTTTPAIAQSAENLTPLTFGYSFVPHGRIGQTYNPSYCAPTATLMTNLETEYNETEIGERHLLTDTDMRAVTIYNPGDKENDTPATASTIIAVGNNAELACLVGSATIKPDAFPEGANNITDPSLFAFHVLPFTRFCKPNNTINSKLEEVMDLPLGDGTFSITISERSEASLNEQPDSPVSGSVEVSDEKLTCMMGMVVHLEADNHAPGEEPQGSTHNTYAPQEYEI